MIQKHDDIAGMAMELGRLIRKEMTQSDETQSPIRMHALCFIHEYPGVRMSELASLMKISPSTATAFIDKLVRAKLVRRSADEKNRKIVCLYLTANGLRACTEHQKSKKQILKKIFGKLSAADRTHLQRIFSLLLADSDSSHD